MNQKRPITFDILIISRLWGVFMYEVNLSENKVRISNAIRLWCFTEGLEEIIDNENYFTNIAFRNEGKTTGFIFEFDKGEELLINKIASAKSVCDYIYVVIDDSKKRKETLDKIPKECGIWCYSDSFGLGFIYQLLKEAQPF